MEKILKLLHTVHAAAVPVFVAADSFVDGKACAKCIIGSNFRRYILGRVEKDVEPAELRVHKLLVPASNKEIISELGGVYETMLTHFFLLLVNNWSTGDPRDLRCPVISYIQGTKLFVRGLWLSDMLFVESSSPGSKNVWEPGPRIISL
ncbi:MAG: hypothetical protein WCW36_01355 [Candidatus Paceibacterota bacterium]